VFAYRSDLLDLCESVWALGDQEREALARGLWQTPDAVQRWLDDLSNARVADALRERWSVLRNDGRDGDAGEEEPERWGEFVADLCKERKEDLQERIRPLAAPLHCPICGRAPINVYRPVTAWALA
jgi:hypothetical protein